MDECCQHENAQVQEVTADALAVVGMHTVLSLPRRQLPIRFALNSLLLQKRLKSMSDYRFWMPIGLCTSCLCRFRIEVSPHWTPLVACRLIIVFTVRAVRAGDAIHSEGVKPSSHHSTADTTFHFLPLI